jgi:hypothetical protein
MMCFIHRHGFLFMVLSAVLLLCLIGCYAQVQSQTRVSRMRMLE